MTSRWKRVWVAARQPPPPPQKLTLREAVAIVATFAVIVVVVGLGIDDWDSVIGGGITAAGIQLIHRWREGRRTRQPEGRNDQ